MIQDAEQTDAVEDAAAAERTARTHGTGSPGSLVIAPGAPDGSVRAVR